MEGSPMNSLFMKVKTDGSLLQEEPIEATPSDPIPEQNGVKSLDASDPKILESVIGPNEIHLYESKEQHGNWLDCIQSGEEPISPVEIGHRACTVCLISHIAMKLPRQLNWDPMTERFINDAEANAMLRRSQKSTLRNYKHSILELMKIRLVLLLILAVGCGQQRIKSNGLPLIQGIFTRLWSKKPCILRLIVKFIFTLQKVAI